ncbi:acetyltransferase [Peribacillus sp. NPDC097295]|uniref:acetyltransferase n=1 Tax=Peribacillus sp. NPDC097295 TaxID=3364402 RepID=UPI0038058198
MKDIVIYGSGGFGREVLELLKNINSFKKEWNILGFLDDLSDTHGNLINGYPILGGENWLKEYISSISIVIAIGNPSKRKIVSKRLQMTNVKFPNLIHPSVIMSDTVKLGTGNIICAGNIITTDIQIGDFTVINVSSTVGHDVIIQNYVTVLPGCNISGNVFIGECADVGTNCTIIPNVKVGSSSIIGAGATIIKDIPSNCTAVGSPARPIKFHEVIS